MIRYSIILSLCMSPLFAMVGNQQPVGKKRAAELPLEQSSQKRLCPDQQDSFQQKGLTCGYHAFINAFAYLVFADGNKSIPLTNKVIEQFVTDFKQHLTSIRPETPEMLSTGDIELLIKELSHPASVIAQRFESFGVTAQDVAAHAQRILVFEYPVNRIIEQHEKAFFSQIRQDEAGRSYAFIANTGEKHWITIVVTSSEDNPEYRIFDSLPATPSTKHDELTRLIFDRITTPALLDYKPERPVVTQPTAPVFVDISDSEEDEPQAQQPRATQTLTTTQTSATTPAVSTQQAPSNDSAPVRPLPVAQPHDLLIETLLLIQAQYDTKDPIYLQFEAMIECITICGERLPRAFFDDIATLVRLYSRTPLDHTAIKQALATTDLHIVKGLSFYEKALNRMYYTLIKRTGLDIAEQDADYQALMVVCNQIIAKFQRLRANYKEECAQRELKESLKKW